MATALHVTSCQDEFRQQQIAVLWRASGAPHAQVSTHTQSCIALCSYFLPVLLPVSTETSGVWACEDSWFSLHCCPVPAVRHMTFFVCGCLFSFLLSFLTISVFVLRFSIFPLPSVSTPLSFPYSSPPPLALTSSPQERLFIITKDTLTKILYVL